MADNLNQILREVYYDPKKGFKSSQALYKDLKKDHPTITKKFIEDFIKRQATSQIHTEKKRDLKQFSQIYAPKVGSYQIDLLDLSNYKSKNSNYRYVLLVVDTYSRFGFVEALKSKNGFDVLKAMKRIEKQIRQKGYELYNFVMDRGVEFDNAQWNDHFKDVKQFRKSPDNHTATGIVERRNREIRHKLEQYFTAYHTLRWTNIIQDINHNINNSENRTIGNTPQSIWDGHAVNEAGKKPEVERLPIDQQVRTLQNITQFQKGTLPKWSKEVFTVEAYNGLGYKLNGKRKKYFRWMLLPIGTVENAVNTTDIREENRRKNSMNRKLRNVANMLA